MQRERKMKLNKHYSELNESYLFSTIAHKVAAYQKANPDKDIIRLGIGDVTLPLAKSVTDAMLKAVEEQGKKETFHGYIPSEQGYEFLRSAIQKYYAGHGVELDMAEIFVSDGAKSDLGNLLDLFDVDNTVLVPDPVYPVYVDDNVMAGRKILYMSASAENNFLPMPDDNVHADIVYLCSPNNPTGATYTVDQLKEWVRWAKANNALILFDAAYEAFITGQGDLLATTPPYTSQLAADPNYVKVADLYDVMGAPLVDTISVQNEVAETRGDDLVALLDCLYTAMDILATDDTLRAEYGMRIYASEGTTYTEDDMASEIANQSYFTWDMLREDVYEFGATMINIGAFFVDQGMIEADDYPNIEASMDHSFIERAIAYHDAKNAE